MSNHYVIQWKSKVNGRAGRGTKLFRREEAEQLVAELNREYPQILHEVVKAQPPNPSAETAARHGESLEEQANEEPRWAASNHSQPVPVD